MPRIMQRLVQYIAPGKLEALNELDRKFDVVEKSLDFPPKRRYLSIAGPEYGTLIIEREWESLAEMEQADDKCRDHPEWTDLVNQVTPLIVKEYWELYRVL